MALSFVQVTKYPTEYFMNQGLALLHHCCNTVCAIVYADLRYIESVFIHIDK